MRILKNGIIKGGEIDTYLDLVNDEIRVFGHVKVGISVIIKKVEFDEKKKIQKEWFKSTSFWKGRKERIEDVDIEVVSNHGDYAIVSFQHEKSDNGIVEVSLKSEYAEIVRIVGKTEYMGKEITIEAVK